MEIDLVQVLLSLLSGVIGGGIIVAWIEIQRHRHEKEEWKLKDKKIDIKVLAVESNVSHWDPSLYNNEKEKLSIYEKGLNNKVSKWLLVIKISYSNLTDRDILITSAELEIPMPSYEISKKVSENKRQFYPITLHKYNLMEKTLITSFSFPLVLPQKTTAGIVFLGEWDFYYPYLVSSVPSTSTFIIKLDDGMARQISIDFNNAEPIQELAYSSKGNPHWEPALVKSKVEIEEEEEENEIPF